MSLLPEPGWAQSREEKVTGSQEQEKPAGSPQPPPGLCCTARTHRDQQGGDQPCRAALSALHPLGTVRLTSHPLPAGRRAPRCSGSPSPRCGEALSPGKVRGAGTHTLRAVPLPSELTLPRAFLPCPAAGNSVINTTEYFTRDSKETW